MSAAVITLRPDDIFSCSSPSRLLMSRIVRSAAVAETLVWMLVIECRWRLGMRRLHEPEEANYLPIEFRLFLVNGPVKMTGGNYPISVELYQDIARIR